MKKNLVLSSVAAIAAINPEGFTINAANLQPVSTGYAVALKRTQITIYGTRYYLDEFMRCA